MNDIINTAQEFGTLYEPKSALVFYESLDKNATMYVEHFDMDRNGNPINAHPLTVNEAKDMEWLISQGVDFITTNEPVVLEEILKKK